MSEQSGTCGYGRVIESIKKSVLEGFEPRVRLTTPHGKIWTLTPEVMAALQMTDAIMQETLREEGAFGRLSAVQSRAVADVVRGRVVYDLGCGMGLLSHVLVGLGASRVVAVDQQALDRPCFSSKISYRVQSYRNLDDIIPCAFVSWPDWEGGEALAKHSVIDLVTGPVVYLGKNSDGVVCGSRRFWQSITKREVLAHIADRRNTLIVYGPRREPERRLYFEEWAGLTMDDQPEPLFWHHRPDGEETEPTFPRTYADAPRKR